jgi:anti-sigma factor RsiW
MSLLRPAEIPCQEVVELVTDYLEDALSRADRRRFENHLAGCPHCSAYLAQMRDTLRLTGHLIPEDLSPEMQREFTAIYERWQSGG